jgi:hypothetical protein
MNLIVLTFDHPFITGQSKAGYLERMRKSESSSRSIAKNALQLGRGHMHTGATALMTQPAIRFHAMEQLSPFIAMNHDK